jgi:HEPN domain-containing protein
MNVIKYRENRTGGKTQMTDQEKFAYWLEYAEYDLQTAEAMFAAGRWMYVIFMCQQALEKLVKGLYLLYIDDNVPKIHDIPSLFSRFMDKLPQPVNSEYIKLFRDLSAYYLNTRYPKYKEKLSEVTNEGVAKSFLEQAKEAFKWLLTLKP